MLLVNRSALLAGLTIFIGAGVFLLMKNVVSSYNEHWLLIIGITFICCVMFFPSGIWGALRDLSSRRVRQ